VDESVDTLEPVFELRVLVGVLVDLVDGFDKIVGRRVVRKSLDQSLDVCQPMLVFRSKA